MKIYIYTIFKIKSQNSIIINVFIFAQMQITRPIIGLLLYSVLLKLHVTSRHVFEQITASVNKNPSNQHELPPKPRLPDSIN